MSNLREGGREHDKAITTDTLHPTYCRPTPCTLNPTCPLNPATHTTPGRAPLALPGLAPPFALPGLTPPAALPGLAPPLALPGRPPTAALNGRSPEAGGVVAVWLLDESMEEDADDWSPSSSAWGE